MSLRLVAVCDRSFGRVLEDFDLALAAARVRGLPLVATLAIYDVTETNGLAKNFSGSVRLGHAERTCLDVEISVKRGSGVALEVLKRGRCLDFVMMRVILFLNAGLMPNGASVCSCLLVWPCTANERDANNIQNNPKTLRSSYPGTVAIQCSSF